jgi:hypothetical protein
MPQRTNEDLPDATPALERLVEPLITGAISNWLSVVSSVGNSGDGSLPATPEATASRAVTGLAGGGSVLTSLLPVGGGATWLRWLNPIAGLASLFGGSRPAPEQFLEPTKSSPSAGLWQQFGVSESSDWSPTPIDYSEQGLPRGAATHAAPASNITIQIQALDSRSILDRSDEIADAIRKSLLESHSLTDTLREL